MQFMIPPTNRICCNAAQVEGGFQQSTRDRKSSIRVLGNRFAELAIPESESTGIAMEDNGMHLFCLYNWSYAIRLVFAHDRDTAKKIAEAAGHIRNGKFRRITELTPDSDQFSEDEAKSLRHALATATDCGLVEYNAEANEWVVRKA